MQICLSKGILSVGGDITVKTFTRADYRTFEQACRQNPTVIDWSAVKRADSACISLLLSVIRTVRPQPVWRNLPLSLQALVELYEIRDWIHS